MEKYNLKNVSDEIREKYKNTLLSKVNDHCLRMSVMEGEYEWHYHPNSDELFIMLEGELIIEFENESEVRLKPNDVYVVPAKMIHKSRVEMRSVNLCFELTEAETVFVDK